jgi:hypothetical protein
MLEIAGDQLMWGTLLTKLNNLCKRHHRSVGAGCLSTYRWRSLQRVVEGAIGDVHHFITTRIYYLKIRTSKPEG